MMLRPVYISCLASVAFAAGAAETAPPDEKNLTPKEALKARMRAEGRKPPPVPAPTPAAPTAATSPGGTGAAEKKAPEKPAPSQPTVLPKVEVRNSRITELDQKIAKQELEIAREKQHTKSTEMDRALNDPKVTRIFSIFGGESSEHRAGIAQERVSLMEAEKDLLEAMKLARTKEEKAEFQKQLDELRAYRRELEKSLR